ncbi:tetrameric acyl-CoA thioesterase, partial [Leptospira barantonii]
RNEADEKRKLDAFFQTKVYDEKTGKVVAELDKVVYVRRKERIKKEKNSKE